MKNPLATISAVAAQIFAAAVAQQKQQERLDRINGHMVGPGTPNFRPSPSKYCGGLIRNKRPEPCAPGWNLDDRTYAKVAAANGWPQRATA